MKWHRSTLVTGAFLLTVVLEALAGSEPPLPPKLRLGNEARPVAYTAELTILPEKETFAGQITIELRLARRTSFLWLHGHGLTVTNVFLQQHGHRIPAKPVAGGEEFLGFAFELPAEAGSAQLTAAYWGKVADQNARGLFHRREGALWYASSQCSWTFARRIFPCFDEPCFKVPWRLTLHVREADTPLSNTPIDTESQEPGGMKCVRFAATPPLPSYLVAVAVGPFEMVDLGKVGQKHTPVRIFTPKGRTAEAAFAAQAIPNLLRRLEEYYGMPYPYEKLDHVGMPQKEGAMENAGLIIYDDTILLNPPQREPIWFKRLLADVCAHEMAHQWFGDLVTMAWWDDLWLKEAFATWMANKVVNAWKPEWRVDLDQTLAGLGMASADSLVSARAIRQPIQAPHDIEDAFDGITYLKGAAVLRMFESWVGEGRFREGIQNYLHRHAWRNATTADFLRALNRAAHQDIASAFCSFLNQPGIPLVSAELQQAPKAHPTLVLSQRRYLPVGSTGDTNRTWRIPIRCRYRVGEREAHFEHLLVNPVERIELPGERGLIQWLMLNQQAAGYYIVAYHGRLLRELVGHGFQDLSPSERLSLRHSIGDAVNSADIPLGEALAIQPTFLHDPERRIVTEAVDFIGGLDEMVPAELKPNYRRYLHQIIDPMIKDVGWESPPNESDDARLQRLALLSLAAEQGEDARLIADAKRLALAWLADHKAVQADAVSEVLSLTGRNADRVMLDRLLGAAKKEKNRNDRESLLIALASCRDLGLAQRVLEVVRARDFLSDESWLLLSWMSSRPETRRLAFDYLKDHYQSILAAIPNEGVALPLLATDFHEPERREEVKAFFQDKDDKVTGGPRTLAHVVELIDLNHAFWRAQQPNLVQFLNTQ